MITIQPVDDTTQLANLEDFSINYVVGNPSAHVSNTITVADPDNDSLEPGGDLLHRRLLT